MGQERRLVAALGEKVALVLEQQVENGFLQQFLEAEQHSVAPLVLASAAKPHQGREIPDKEERVAKAPVGAAEFVDSLESGIGCDTG